MISNEHLSKIDVLHLGEEKILVEVFALLQYQIAFKKQTTDKSTHLIELGNFLISNYVFCEYIGVNCL